MSSEASKIRNQCARKFGLREKAYKDRIKDLERELSEKTALLEDYKSMQRAYMKLLVYTGLSEKERNRILKSEELERTVENLAKMFGIRDSKTLEAISSAVIKDGKTFVSAFEELLGGEDEE